MVERRRVRRVCRAEELAHRPLYFLHRHRRALDESGRVVGGRGRGRKVVSIYVEIVYPFLSLFCLSCLSVCLSVELVSLNETNHKSSRSGRVQSGLVWSGWSGWVER